MGVLKEFLCPAHGRFDSDVAKCPHGCDFVVDRVFHTAPGTRSAKTRATDVLLRDIAQQYGFTDMSTKNGSVMASQRKEKPAMDFSPVWGDIPKGDRQTAGGVIEKVEGSQGGAQAGANQYRVAPGTPMQTTGGEGLSFADVAKAMPQPRPELAAPAYGTAADVARTAAP